MKPYRHRDTDTVLGAPRDWDAEANGECVGLPVRNAHGTMFSYWRPTMSERIRLLFGGHVRLGVFGSSHPPVAIDTLT